MNLFRETHGASENSQTLELLGNDPHENEDRFLIETRTLRGAAEIGRAVVPFTVEFPEDPADIVDPRPKLIINGYGGKEFGYDAIRTELAKRGNFAISMRPYGFVSWFDEWDPRHLFQAEKPRSKAAWGVMRAVQQDEALYEGIDTEKFDLIGHSWGLHVAVTVAKHKPHAVANIINKEGVGCEDSNSIFRMIPRILPFIKDEAWPAYKNGELEFAKGWQHALRSEIDYFLPNFPKAMAEAYTAATADVRQDLGYLKRVHNIGLAALVGTADNLIPADKTVAASWHRFDYGVVLEDATHMDPISSVKAARFADEIVKALQYLNNPTPLATAA